MLPVLLFHRSLKIRLTKYVSEVITEPGSEILSCFNLFKLQNRKRLKMPEISKIDLIFLSSGAALNFFLSKINSTLSQKLESFFFKMKMKLVICMKLKNEFCSVKFSVHEINDAMRKFSLRYFMQKSNNHCIFMHNLSKNIKFYYIILQKVMLQNILALVIQFKVLFCP